VAEERALWAEKALDEVRNLYRNQVVGVDGLLQAEVAWTQAEVSRAGAVFDARIARAVLRQSLGDFADGILSEPL
jgi:outer membrane protein TolC